MKRILLIENFGADFFNSRMPLAKFLIERGYMVFALVPEDDYVNRIKEGGINVISYPFSRKNKGILQILKLVLLYRRIANEYRIDIVHSFRFQPNLINVFASVFSKRRVILHITGLGITFSNDSIRYRLLRFLSRLIYFFKILLADVIVVQNPDDIQDLWGSSLFKGRIVLIKGSGVNTQVFGQRSFQLDRLKSKEKITFVCVTRLLWEKGIRELAEAFLLLTEDLQDRVELNIVGGVDFENPRAVSKEFIERFDSIKCVNFLGSMRNIPDLLCRSDVFIFPSYYREGIPRGILEALSTGLPIVTTKMPGCNLTIEEGVNGFFVEPRNSVSIVKVVEKIMGNLDLIPQMGTLSRNRAMEEFSCLKIFAEIEKLYCT